MWSSPEPRPPGASAGRLALALAMCLALGACGFHLRGSRSLDVDVGKVHVSERGAPQLARELQRLIAYSDVPRAGSVTDADLLVSFGGESSERRVLSVDPETGKVREFEMGYEAFVTVRRADGTPLIDNQRIQLRRDYVFDETAALGKFEEERLLLRELRQDAAETVLQRLASLGR